LTAAFPDIKILSCSILQDKPFTSNHLILEDVTADSRMCSPLDTEVEDLADDVSSTAGLQEQLSEIQRTRQVQTESLNALEIKVRKRNQIGGKRLCRF
jgi:hypothetical protein